jgi:hypothetical protein
MIFSVKRLQLTTVTQQWVPKELELEKLIFSGRDAETEILNEAVFGEPLLKVKRQLRTPSRKRLDILALDRRGNAVVVELKKDRGSLGMDIQALHYLAEITPVQGEGFLAKFPDDPDQLRQAVQGFLDPGISIEDLNQKQRLVLLARSFHPSLFSMGKWIGDRGIPFRCIEYTPFRAGREKFLSFSVASDQGPADLYPLDFSQPKRQPGVFWHNIGSNEQKWWEYLLDRGEIPAGFTNSPGDEGERILRGYVKGDRIVAYANRSGALGWASIEKPDYRLIPADSEEAKRGYYRHRLKVNWRSVTRRLANGLRAAQFEKNPGIVHPRRTSNRILDQSKAARLIEMLNQRFGT